MELETVAGSFGQKPKDAGKKENFWSRASKGGTCVLMSLPQEQTGVKPPTLSCQEHDHRIGPASAWRGQCVCAQPCPTL